MKTYLCNRIERANSSSIKSIANGTVEFYPGNYFGVIDEVTQSVFTEEMKTTDAGQLITQKLSVNCIIDSKTSGDINRQPQIFRLTFSNGQILIWGTKQNPVLCSDSLKEIDALKINFLRKTPFFDL